MRCVTVEQSVKKVEDTQPAITTLQEFHAIQPSFLILWFPKANVRLGMFRCED